MSSKELSQKSAPSALHQLFDFLSKCVMILTVVAVIAGYALASDRI
ncbi:ABC transporter permease, partial [Erwinia amylovora]|nr:ABC transporter permease [Erwinia amylovora]